MKAEAIELHRNSVTRIKPDDHTIININYDRGKFCRWVLEEVINRLILLAYLGVKKCFSNFLLTYYPLERYYTYLTKNMMVIIIYIGYITKYWSKLRCSSSPQAYRCHNGRPRIEYTCHNYMWYSVVIRNYWLLTNHFLVGHCI